MAGNFAGPGVAIGWPHRHRPPRPRLASLQMTLFCSPLPPNKAKISACVPGCRISPGRDFLAFHHGKFALLRARLPPGFVSPSAFLSFILNLVYRLSAQRVAVSRLRVKHFGTMFMLRNGKFLPRPHRQDPSTPKDSRLQPRCSASPKRFDTRAPIPSIIFAAPETTGTPLTLVF